MYRAIEQRRTNCPSSWDIRYHAYFKNLRNWKMEHVSYYYASHFFPRWLILLFFIAGGVFVISYSLEIPKAYSIQQSHLFHVMHIKQREIYRDSTLMPARRSSWNMKVGKENSLQVYIIKRALHIKIHVLFYTSLHLRVYSTEKKDPLICKEFVGWRLVCWLDIWVKTSTENSIIALIVYLYCLYAKP